MWLRSLTDEIKYSLRAICLDFRLANDSVAKINGNHCTGLSRTRDYITRSQHLARRWIVPARSGHFLPPTHMPAPSPQKELRG